MDSPQISTDSGARVIEDVEFASTQFPPEIAPTLRILEEYSGVAPEEIPGLISKIQGKAFAIFPYGCIKSFGFLNLTPTLEDPRYQTVLKRLRVPGSTETFLEAGCCLGTVARHLASQGVPDDRLYGTDLHAGYLDLGYELFGDRARSRATYVAGDMLVDGSTSVDTRLDDALKGKIDIIYASNFFHLFEREGQLRAARRMAGFLRPESPGVLIFGQNQGPKIEGWEKYVLDPGSWTVLWDEVGQTSGTKWRTEMEVNSTDEWNIVRFGVYRVI
ncbi:hypothetical protein PG990_003089 [Apiospora arundinis]